RPAGGAGAGACPAGRRARVGGLRRRGRRRQPAGHDRAPPTRRPGQGGGLRARRDRGGGRGGRVGRARRARPPRRRRVDDRAVGAAAGRGRAVTSPSVPSRKLLIATRNEGKIREIRDLFHGLPFQLAFPVDQLLERLPGVPDAQRTARYRCVVAYLDTPLAKPQLVEATCEGRVLTEPRGTGGFGYDPLFFSLDLEMAFAEAPLPAKQRVSHRGR